MIRMDPTSIDRYRKSPEAFCRDLNIEIGNQTVCWGDVMRPFQQDFIRAVSPGLSTAVGLPVSDAERVILRALLELPRGHAKTMLVAALIIWALLFAPRMVRIIAAAVDRDQARLIRDAIHLLCKLNPAIGECLEVNQYTVRNVAEGSPAHGSMLEVITSDVPSSWGFLVDAAFCDEVSIWPNADLFGSLLTTVAKKSTAFLGIISNAGNNKGEDWVSLDAPPKKQPGEHWFWSIREQFRLDPSCHFARLDGPDPSILSPERIPQLERMLPPGTSRRTIWNEWVIGGEGVFSQTEIKRLIKRDGPMLSHPGGPYFFVAGIDAASNRDHFAVVTLGIELNTGRLFLADSRSWNPADYGGNLDFGIVKTALLESHRRRPVSAYYFDRWNMDFLAAELAREGLAMYAVNKTPETLNRMALSLLDTIRGGTIELFDDPLLTRDLTRVSITERQNGFKIELPRDSIGGHCDRCEALCLCLPFAHDILQGRIRIIHPEPPEPERHWQNDTTWSRIR